MSSTKNTTKEANKLNNIAVEGTTVTATATTAGATTGTIPKGADFVIGVGVTGQTGYKILLPDDEIGKRIIIRNVSGFTFQLATSAAASIGINGGIGSGYKVAVATNKTAICTRITATEWNVAIGDSAVAA